MINRRQCSLALLVVLHGVFHGFAALFEVLASPGDSVARRHTEHHGADIEQNQSALDKTGDDLAHGQSFREKKVNDAAYHNPLVVQGKLFFACGPQMVQGGRVYS